MNIPPLKLPKTIRQGKQKTPQNRQSHSSSSSCDEKIELRIERSPSFEQRRIEHKWKVKEIQHQDRWKSCCFEIDRRATQYFCQIGIISGVMIFCIYQLIHLNSCEDQNTYLGLLSLLLGLLMPNPKFGDKKI